MTLKQLIHLFDFKEIWEELKEIEYQEKNKSGYVKAWKALKKAVPNKNLKNFYIESGVEKDGFGYCVLVNTKYNPKNEELLPYGGDPKNPEDAPSGHTNINSIHNNKYLSILSSDWGDFIDLEFQDKTGNIKRGLAEFMFQLTFEGFSPEEHKAFIQQMEKLITWVAHTIAESVKNKKNGK